MKVTGTKNLILHFKFIENFNLWIAIMPNSTLKLASTEHVWIHVHKNPYVSK